MACGCGSLSAAVYVLIFLHFFLLKTGTAAYYSSAHYCQKHSNVFG